MLLLTSPLLLATCRDKHGKVEEQPARSVEMSAEQMAKEAPTSLERMRKGTVDYLEGKIDGGAKAGPGLYPPSTDWTPSKPCCEQEGGVCNEALNEKAWEQGTWGLIGFSMDQDFRYQYRVTQDEEFEGMLMFQARGDLDCDGTYSMYEVALEVTEDGEIQLGPGLYTLHGLE
jgi:hypothetical protein